jgi:HK97 family phage portal protein
MLDMIRRMFGRRSVETRASGDPVVAALRSVGTYADAGVNVTTTNALGIAAVWASVRVISDAIATLPIHVFDRETAENRRDHVAAMVLGRSPNPWMTSPIFREAMMVNLLLSGNAYAVIERDEAQDVTALYPVPSCDVSTYKSGMGLAYRVPFIDRHIASTDMLHIQGMSFEGLIGLSPIQYSKQSLGTTIALDSYAAKFFANGANIGGILQLPPMKKEDMDTFVESWRRHYSGAESAFKVAALPDGAKFMSTSSDPEKGQALQSRQHQIREVARIFRVPPHMIGDLEKSSYASIEQQQIEFRQFCIMPWAVKWEAECNRKLLRDSEQGRLEVRFNLDALLRPTTKERYEAYMLGRQAGFLSINDIRRRENLPPIEGGDTYLEPLNMEPAGSQQDDSNE